MRKNESDGPPRLGALALALSTLLLSGWACGRAAPEPDKATVAPSRAATEAPTEEPTESLEPTVTATGVCDPSITHIELGQTVTGMIEGHDQPPEQKDYYCVDVPDGLPSVTFELSGMTAHLNLYVGAPELDNVIHGGFWYWDNHDAGTDPKSVTAQPGMRDFVWRGSYYIEVSPEDWTDSSPYTLEVRTP